MNISKKQLKKIIQEEIQKVLQEKITSVILSDYLRELEATIKLGKISSYYEQALKLSMGQAQNVPEQYKQQLRNEIKKAMEMIQGAAADPMGLDKLKYKLMIDWSNLQTVAYR